MTTPSKLDEARLRELRERSLAATPGEWTVYGERIDGNRMLAAEEALAQVNLTSELANHFWMLNADGKCPAMTGCGPTSEADARFIAAANPATILALLDALSAERERRDRAVGLLRRAAGIAMVDGWATREMTKNARDTVDEAHAFLATQKAES